MDITNNSGGSSLVDNTTRGEKLVIKVPSVGESISEVTISNWKKKEGEFVKMNEILCEIDSDKVTFEIPAEDEGVLHIFADQGDNPIYW